MPDLRNIAAIALLAVSSAAPAQASPRHGAVILYGASWCAPCQNEIRHTAGLAAAALPDMLIIVWDDAPALRQRLAPIGNVRVAADTEASRLIGLIDHREQVGLPYALMQNAAGRPCAFWQGPLQSRDIARLRTLCHNRG